jgi:uncharacterized protein (DUF1684 family)
VRLSLRTVAAIVFLPLAAACSSNPSVPDDDAAIIKEIEGYRAERDQFMRQDAESPIPADKKAVLLPLRYYAPDPTFAVPAVLDVSAGTRPVMEVPTSKGVPRRVELVGTLQFTLKGQKLTLGAFVEEGTRTISSLFVPFADLTTGTETYPAGRYLDLHPTATGIYTIDFNKAYNPFCAYNNSYECPFPPAANRLKVAVTAGEKSPADHAG